MSILRIATSPAELDLQGGTYSTNTSYYDPTRTRGVFKHGQLETSSLSFPPAAGTITWLHFRFAVTRDTANPSFWGNTAADGVVFEFRDSASRRMLLGRIVPTMQLEIMADDGAGSLLRANISTPSNDLVFSIDVKLEISGGNVIVESYYNSALQGTATLSNAGGVTNPDRMYFGTFEADTGSGTPGSSWFGEIVIADEDTRGFRLRELKPQSFGVFQQWDGTVASVADNSLATGVSTDVNGERVSFGLDNLENVNSGDIVNRVVAQTYAQRGPTGLTQFAHFFRYSDTTVQVGPSIAVNTIGAWYMDEYVNNPDTGVAWVPADLAGIQIGLEAQT